MVPIFLGITERALCNAFQPGCYAIDPVKHVSPRYCSLHQPIQNAYDAVPFFGFCAKLFLPGFGNRVELCLPVVVGYSLLGGDPMPFEQS